MTANEVVRKIQQIAPASDAALKLLTLLDQSAIDNEEIVRVLKHDNVLTAKLLRGCNSSFYGFNEPVASVEQAVLVLGHRPILRIVFAIAFNSTLSVPLRSYAFEASELWRHSLVTALACETLAESGLAMQPEPSVAFTAGLLHDIGKVALNQAINEEGQTAIRTRIKEGGKSCIEAETEVLGTDHAQVGACLLKTWKLPEEIVEAVGNHHHPLCTPQPRLSALVNAADVLAHRIGPGFDWESFTAELAPNVISALKLTPEKFKDCMPSLHRSLAQVDHLQKAA